MKGIDIASFEENLDFSKANTDICFIKATEGLTYTNPYLNQQYEQAKLHGMKIGLYHYIRANDPTAECDHFLNAIKNLKSDCLYGIDAEQTNGGIEDKGMSARVRTFADHLISNGKPPVLYTGLDYYNNEILSCCKDIPLWVAAYRSTRPDIKSVGWQYSEAGNIGGITVDLNIFDDGILLSKGVVNVSNCNVAVLQVQEICNLLKVTGKNGVTLLEDGVEGIRTIEATARLKFILNNILK
ncbi:GH25 family lysozyme [Clostridium estertheticum]|uniref:GH25 family lysozyme n=1 Tax=Clostridium estertheticum TaxID=238834 RepID=UPI001C6EFA17|nr:GH25 family lysozyme [Clostridium estertheticum]MBW9154277.1 autolysin [Clostridium estertheticum]WLC86703.1 autolysin [Clostridium estertheticum]